MTKSEHIQKIRDALKGLDKHCENNGAAWTALHDLELDAHELEKAFEDENLMKKSLDMAE